MPAYLVTLDRSKGGHTLVHGADAMVVFATTTAEAKQLAAAQYEGDGLAWINDATATEVTAAADWNGWTFAVDVIGGAAPISVATTGTATDNTVDKIAAALVVALNATPTIAAASYSASTNVLTVAGAADNLGDLSLAVSITPPEGKTPVDALVGTIVDGGAEADPLTVVLPADATAVPQALAAVKQVE